MSDGAWADAISMRAKGAVTGLLLAAIAASGAFAGGFVGLQLGAWAFYIPLDMAATGTPHRKLMTVACAGGATGALVMPWIAVSLFELRAWTGATRRRLLVVPLLALSTGLGAALSPFPGGPLLGALATAALAGAALLVPPREEAP